MAKILMAFLALILAALSLTCSKSTPAPAPLYNSTVTFAQGECFLINDSGMGYVRIGKRITSGDTLLCAFNGKIKLAFNDSDYVVMDHNTKAVITSDTLFNVTVLILNGRVYSNVVILPKKGSFRAITPKLTTAVRGTAYTIEVDSEKTAINVLEGRVSVSDNDSLCPIEVNRGERAVINPGRFPCRIQTATLKELKDLVRWVGRSFLRFQKIMEYKNDVAYISNLQELNLVPQDFADMGDIYQGNRGMMESTAPGTKRRMDTQVEVPVKKINKPKLQDLSKINLPEDSLRTPDHIRARIGSHRHLLQSLYNQTLRKGEPFQGRVIVRFVIEPSGKISDPAIVSSSTGRTDFDSLLVLRLLQLRFEPVKTVGDMSIVYPFDFAGK